MRWKRSAASRLSTAVTRYLPRCRRRVKCHHRPVGNKIFKTYSRPRPPQSAVCIGDGTRVTCAVKAVGQTNAPRDDDYNITLLLRECRENKKKNYNNNALCRVGPTGGEAEYPFDLHVREPASDKRASRLYFTHQILCTA